LPETKSDYFNLIERLKSDAEFRSDAMGARGGTDADGEALRTLLEKLSPDLSEDEHRLVVAAWFDTLRIPAEHAGAKGRLRAFIDTAVQRFGWSRFEL
jgi:hypothetical protein